MSADSMAALVASMQTMRIKRTWLATAEEYKEDTAGQDDGPAEGDGQDEPPRDEETKEMLADEPPPETRRSKQQNEEVRVE